MTPSQRVGLFQTFKGLGADRNYFLGCRPLSERSGGLSNSEGIEPPMDADDRMKGSGGNGADLASYARGIGAADKS